MTFSQRIVPLVAVAGVALAGCGGTSAVTRTTGSATPQALSAPQGTTGTQRAAPGAPAGGPSDTQVASLAEALGVTTAKLRSALEEARPTAGRAPEDMSTVLAGELGLSVSKVDAALESFRPAAPSSAPPSSVASAT